MPLGLARGSAVRAAPNPGGLPRGKGAGPRTRSLEFRRRTTGHAGLATRKLWGGRPVFARVSPLGGCSRESRGTCPEVDPCANCRPVRTRCAPARQCLHGRNLEVAVQAMISTLMVLVACILDGKTEAPTYGQVIEAMAQAAWELKEPRLSALVSDLSLQCLERGQWAESEGAGTVRVLSRKLRNRGRASLRTRHQATSRKRAQRARQRLASGGAKDSTPVPHGALRPARGCLRALRADTGSPRRAAGGRLRITEPACAGLSGGDRCRGAALSGGCRPLGHGIRRPGPKDPLSSAASIADLARARQGATADV